MAEGDAGERTHEPTWERLRKAEEAGDFAFSREVVTAVSFVGGLILLWAIHLRLWSLLEDCARDYFAFTRHWAISVPTSGRLLWSALSYVVRLCWPILLAALVLGFLANIWQTGGVRTAPRKQMFNLSRLNPAAGMRRLFAPAHLFEAVKVVVKATIFVAICYKAIRKNLDRILTLGAIAPKQALEATVAIALQIFLWVAVMIIILAIIDYAFQKHQYRRKLRMTTQEVKEEHKELEGDPQNKRRQRTKQLEMSRNRMIVAVRRANVVVTNPTHYAVALRYDPARDGAPRLEAKGARLMAERIKEEARAHGVPIVEDRYVARAVYFGVKIGQEIPYNLYRAVAEILAHVYRLTGKTPPRGKGAPASRPRRISAHA